MSQFIIKKCIESYLNYYIIWSLLVSVVIYLSITWSLASSLAIGQSNKYILTIAMYILALLIINKEKFYTALKLFILSRLVMLV